MFDKLENVFHLQETVFKKSINKWRTKCFC